jgi:hypothetical protein
MNRTKLFSLGMMAAVCACGGSGNSPAGNGGTGGGDAGGGTALATVSIDLTGQGTITSPDGSFNCSSSCTKPVAVGTALHLDATPAAGMEFTGWSGACSGTLSCALTVTGDVEVGAVFVADAVTLEVDLVGSGTGHVASTPPGIDCPGTCAISFPMGTLVILTGTADATSHFEGWGGGCHGLTCAATISAATTVFANFSAEATGLLHSLAVHVTGSGTVSSTPPGIDCPGSCSATFPEGSTVALSATAGQGLSLTWGGACSGSGDCSVPIAADTSVSATFADPCAGLLPGLPDPLAAAFSVNGDGLQCSSANSDGKGDAFALAASFTSLATVFASGVAVPVRPAVALGSGFATLDGQTANALTSYGPDGQVAGTATLPPGLDSPVVAGVNGGSAMLVFDCTDATHADVLADWQVVRFDDAGALAGNSTLSGQECAGGNVLVDAKGNLLLTAETVNGHPGVPPGHYTARWLDPAGTPLTEWFDLGDSKSNAVSLLVRPLIGGGVALRFDGSWTKTIASGKAEVVAGQPFDAGKDLRIVEGGKAYLTIPDFGKAGALDVIAPNGKVCGAVIQSDGVAQFYLGKDGTLIRLEGANHCQATYFPGLLK